MEFTRLQLHALISFPTLAKHIFHPASIILDALWTLRAGSLSSQCPFSCRCKSSLFGGGSIAEEPGDALQGSNISVIVTRRTVLNAATVHVCHRVDQRGRDALHCRLLAAYR